MPKKGSKKLPQKVKKGAEFECGVCGRTLTIESIETVGGEEGT